MSTGEVMPDSMNRIAAGTNIVGEIETTGAIRIDGNLKGNITTKGKLIIGPTGVILGDINCKEAVIEGKTEGKIKASDILHLKAKSNIKGDIVTNKLAVEPGALFTGSCAMNGAANSMVNGKKTAK